MPTAEGEALEAARAARERGEDELEAYQAAYDRALAERHERLKRDASASYRAMQGWSKVKSQQDWEQIVLDADAAFESGTFLLERLGADRYLDPPLAAVLLRLRRRLIEEYGAETAAELLLVDSILLAYYQQMRITGWLGDLQGWLEREFFELGSLTASATRSGAGEVREVRGLRVEAIVERIVERLAPLVDRSNRMLIRNLKALRALREGPVPSVSIGSAGQVNVAAAQVNGATPNTRMHDGYPHG
jgi:hypothetical protein